MSGYNCNTEGCSIGDCPSCIAVAWERKVAAEWRRAAELGDADCLAARAELAALRETCDRLALENVNLAAKLHMRSNPEFTREDVAELRDIAADLGPDGFPETALHLVGLAARIEALLPRACAA
jgi:hypothetical protein